MTILNSPRPIEIDINHSLERSHPTCTHSLSICPTPNFCFVTMIYKSLVISFAATAAAARFHKRQVGDSTSFQLYAYGDDIGGLPLISAGCKCPEPKNDTLQRRLLTPRYDSRRFHRRSCFSQRHRGCYRDLLVLPLTAVHHCSSSHFHLPSHAR